MLARMSYRVTESFEKIADGATHGRFRERQEPDDR